MTSPSELKQMSLAELTSHFQNTFSFDPNVPPAIYRIGFDDQILEDEDKDELLLKYINCVELHPLKQGLYVVTEDVVNTKADRRTARQFESMPVWKKGMQVYCKFNRHSVSLSCSDMFGQIYLHRDEKEYWGELVSKLSPVKLITVGSILVDANENGSISPESILAMLVQRGEVTPSVIMDAVDALRKFHEEATEEEYEAWHKKHKIW